jgi:hypothetical protein
MMLCPMNMQNKYSTQALIKMNSFLFSNTLNKGPTVLFSTSSVQDTAAPFLGEAYFTSSNFPLQTNYHHNRSMCTREQHGKCKRHQGLLVLPCNPSAKCIWPDISRFLFQQANSSSSFTHKKKVYLHTNGALTSPSHSQSRRCPMSCWLLSAPQQTAGLFPPMTELHCP